MITLKELLTEGKDSKETSSPQVSPEVLRRSKTNPLTKTIKNISKHVARRYGNDENDTSAHGRFLITKDGDIHFGSGKHYDHRMLGNEAFGYKKAGEIHGYTYHHPKRGYEYAAWKTNHRFDFNRNKEEHLSGEHHPFLKKLEDNGFKRRHDFEFTEEKMLSFKDFILLN